MWIALIISVSWLICSVVAYHLVRYEMCQGGRIWTHMDRAFGILLSVIGGPITIIHMLTRIVAKGDGWDEPSKW